MLYTLYLQHYNWFYLNSCEKKKEFFQFWRIFLDSVKRHYESNVLWLKFWNNLFFILYFRKNACSELYFSERIHSLPQVNTFVKFFGVPIRCTWFAEGWICFTNRWIIFSKSWIWSAKSLIIKIVFHHY